jgi:hypothetical protein
MRQQEEDDIRKLLFGGRGHMLRDLFMASQRPASSWWRMSCDCSGNDEEEDGSGKAGGGGPDPGDSGGGGAW